MGQGARGFGLKPVDQGPQDRRLEQTDFADLGDPPGLELGTARQRQILQKPAPEQTGGLLEPGQLERRQMLPRHVLDAPQVEGDRRAAQGDPVSVGDELISSIDVHDPPNFREAPSKGAARIVRRVPEHPAKVLASLRTIDDRQVRQQRTRFPRRRKGDALAMAEHGEFTKHAEVEQPSRLIRFSRHNHSGRGQRRAAFFITNSDPAEPLSWGLENRFVAALFKVIAAPKRYLTENAIL